MYLLYFLNMANLSLHEIDTQLIKLGFEAYYRKQMVNIIHNQPALLSVLQDTVPHLLGKKCGLTKMQITMIVLREHNIQNLRAYKQYYEFFKKTKLAGTDLIKISYSNEPYIFLPILHDCWQELIKDKIALNEIIYLATIVKTKEQAKAIIPYIKTFVELQISRKYVYFFLENHLLKEAEKIFKYGFQNNHLDLLFQHPEPLISIHALLDNYENLKLALDNNDCAPKHRSHTDNYALAQQRCFDQTIPDLTFLGFSSRKLSSILLKQNGVEKITALNILNSYLLPYGYTRNELLKNINENNGIAKLLLLSSVHLSLTEPSPILISDTNDLQETESIVYQDEMAQYQKEIDEMIENERINISQSPQIALFSIFSNHDNDEEMRVAQHNYENNLHFFVAKIKLM